VGGLQGSVGVGVAGQLSPADPAAGHHHRLGPAQALVQVALAAGLTFELAWLEYPATRGRERRLKNQGSAYRRCPLCRGTGGPLDPVAAVAAIQRPPLPHPRPSGGR